MQIDLTRGSCAVIDDADLPMVSAFSWHLLSGGYAGTTWWDATAKKRRHAVMHRLLLSAPRGSQIDHIDGDRLNNRRSNLRFATAGQNARNARPHGASGFNGVRQTAAGQWLASISPDRTEINLGQYKTAIEAAGVYDAAARIVYGEFARLNNVTPRDAALSEVIEGKAAAVRRLEREIAFLRGQK